MIAGCLWISRESILIGLNNLDIYSIQRQSFSDCFGFTQREVEELAAYCELKEKMGETKDWSNTPLKRIIHESKDNLWNFLYFTGYLKKVSERFYG